MRKEINFQNALDRLVEGEKQPFNELVAQLKANCLQENLTISNNSAIGICSAILSSRDFIDSFSSLRLDDKSDSYQQALRGCLEGFKDDEFLQVFTIQLMTKIIKKAREKEVPGEKLCEKLIDECKSLLYDLDREILIYEYENGLRSKSGKVNGPVVAKDIEPYEAFEMSSGGKVHKIPGKLFFSDVDATVCSDDDSRFEPLRKLCDQYNDIRALYNTLKDNQKASVKIDKFKNQAGTVRGNFSPQSIPKKIKQFLHNIDRLLASFFPKSCSWVRSRPSLFSRSLVAENGLSSMEKKVKSFEVGQSPGS